MTTNSPNPVDGDVQALICALEILKPEIATSPALTKAVDIALASLTALPLGYIRAEDAALLPFERKNTCVEVAIYNQRSFTTDLKIYTTPPAQLLRQVELPEPYDDGHGNLWLPQDAVISAVKNAGGEVKS